MERGSNSESTNKADKQKGKKLGSKIEPFVTQGDHNARDLRSWAKRTGFVSIFSGEVGTSRGRSSTNRDGFRGESGGGSMSPKIESDPVQATTRNRSFEIEPDSNRNRNNSEADPILPERGENERGNTEASANWNNGEHNKIDDEYVGKHESIDITYPGGKGESEWNQPEMKYGIRDNPGFGLFSPSSFTSSLSIFYLMNNQSFHSLSESQHPSSIMVCSTIFHSLVH